MPRQSRQRPVSCSFCRVRKLRCSRDFPCTNCTSRGRQCPHPTDDKDVHQAPLSVSALAAAVSSLSPTSSAGDGAILSRLERLEALLATHTKEPQSAHGLPVDTPSSVTSHQSEKVVTQQNVLPPILPPNAHKLDADAVLLEQSTFDSPNPNDTAVLSNSFVFRICPIRLITPSATPYIFQSSPCGSFPEPVRCIWLPQREEAKEMVNAYIEELIFLQHITHGPALRLLVDQVYDSLQSGADVHLGSVALMLSVCADITYLWTPSISRPAINLSDAEAKCQSSFWTKATLDVLDHGHRNSHVSIEAIQATMMLTFIIGNMEGIAIRSRTIVAQGITMARELSLHRIDCRLLPGQVPRYTGIQAEIGRRVWWYLAATDWMLSRFSGPHEGSYTVLPSQMSVNRPLNINDEDLTDDGTIVGRPVEEPTHSSYFLQRVELANLMRILSDRMPHGPAHAEYSVILELDATIDRFLQGIPTFVNLDADGLAQQEASHPRRRAHITIQKHTINLITYSQRCKLHLPFFVRGTFDPAYAYSRTVCLKAAGDILDMERLLRSEQYRFALRCSKLSLIIHSLFSAGLVLLMDLGLKNGATDKSESRTRMRQIWNVLEEARNQSGLAKRLLELLRQVMKKHNVPVPTPHDEPGARSTGIERDQSALPLTPNSGMDKGMTYGDSPSNPDSIDWGNLGTDMDIDGVDWESLMVSFDGPFV
ncbi:unnamed protein product [Clonostachys rosea f. rosea IK726]|uniref:Zn(2)-C6 fungal-type domain-containing protein n=2 Tax=Bionectria ochroleuca TaxID=29856 RepID=A0A0B7K5W9_BIOOC|nr:unnamed protein product [Clonostachys rosea f. rosea IK726]